MLFTFQWLKNKSHGVENHLDVVILGGGGSYFAEHGNGPILMAEKENVAYISTNFWHKRSDGNGNVILEGRKTEIVTDIENDRS